MIQTDIYGRPVCRGIPEARAYAEGLRRQLADAEAELARLLAAAGRRPGDGSDQPSIFDPEQPGLF